MKLIGEFFSAIIIATLGLFDIEAITEQRYKPDMEETNIQS
ncbi:MAG: hypothetical protein CENE_01672 [Candidatus Celerinatantimonas neptuna]|nr:MAG: hypothetical protein CENE_01672 [Candidatus Celerinatantimonas neptuna]